MKRRIPNTAWVVPVFVLFICGGGGDRVGSLEYGHQLLAAGPSEEGSSSADPVLVAQAKPRRSVPTQASPSQP